MASDCAHYSLHKYYVEKCAHYTNRTCSAMETMTPGAHFFLLMLRTEEVWSCYCVSSHAVTR